LKEGKPDLNIKDFLSQVESRVDEIDPQLLDMLLSFTDFQLFKEHMLAYKKQHLAFSKTTEAKETPLAGKDWIQKVLLLTSAIRCWKPQDLWSKQGYSL